ncbi:MAG TPA: flavin reductase family protein [Chloroflexia bacterium]|nr:flavin reductase family protein [Chloroflexia bacterium]
MDEQAKSTSLNQIGYGLYVIGSKAGDELNGMTANWVSQVSFDPPLVVVAIENDSHTRKLIDEGKVFSVNLIEDSEEGRAMIERMVKPQRRIHNKLGDDDFTTGETGAPLLTAALSWFECRVVQTIETGDHQLYIGEVVGAGVQKEGTPLALRALGWHYGG